MKQKAEIGGKKIAYSLQGSGHAPVVVLSHSLGVSSEFWGYQLPLLTARYRVLLYDLPGHGDSEPAGERLSLEQLADDVAGLLEHLRIDRVAFVGLSIGGMIGQVFALRHPEKLWALVLCSTGSRTDSTTRKLLEDRIARVTETGIESQVEGAMGRWFTENFLRSAPATIEWVKNLFRKTSLKGFIGCCGAIQELDTDDQLSEIKVPTLLIPGELDQAFPETVSRSIQARIAGAQLYILPGAAHAGNVEQSHLFNEALINFLAA
ncbi:MAG: alpha/beta fold hydrolase [Verrucomicrobia bacterium]|nr:alpha/beta fold hydrolase [Verrucomicrobiota bacterium]